MTQPLFYGKTGNIEAITGLIADTLAKYGMTHDICGSIALCVAPKPVGSRWDVGDAVLCGNGKIAVCVSSGQPGGATWDVVGRTVRHYTAELVTPLRRLVAEEADVDGG